MRILFISANPKWEAQLELGDELRTLLASLRGQDVDLMLLPAAQPEDLKIALGSKQVDVIHFSGHAKEDGILLRDSEGYAKQVKPEELRELLAERNIKLAVLNACNTKPTADEIQDLVGAVVGTTKVLDDRAARQMTKVFYSTLGAGQSFAAAFDEATNSIEKSKLPNVYTKGGSTTDAPVFPAGEVAEGEVRIEGQAPFDRYYYVNYLEQQIRNLVGRIRLNRALFVVLLVASLFLAHYLWVNTPANLGRIAEFGWDPVNWPNIFGAPVLDSLMALGAGIPALISLLQGRLLIHGNAELQSLKRLKELAKASDDMTPELRDKLEKVLKQSISGADTEYGARVTSIDWYRVFMKIDNWTAKIKSFATGGRTAASASRTQA